MRQINPDVVAAFPITPSTQIVEDFSQFVANGEELPDRLQRGAPEGQPLVGVSP